MRPVPLPCQSTKAFALSRVTKAFPRQPLLRAGAPASSQGQLCLAEEKQRFPTSGCKKASLSPQHQAAKEREAATSLRKF